ncbi:MAG TPA: SH3 domain-containing protein, partial [Nocardioides sp.]
MSAPLAVVATLSAVTMGVLSADPATSDNTELLAAGNTRSYSNATAMSRRGDVTASRSQIRTAAKAESAARKDLEVDRTARRMAKKLGDTLWTTEALNLWEGPSEKSDKLGLVDALQQVRVTGRRQAGRTQIVVDGQSRWVTSDYLAQDKPKPEPEEPAGPSLGGTCSNGSTID